MKIDLSPDQLRHEIERGGRFVIFTYCISIVVMTFKRPSSVQFIRAGESRFWKGAPWSLISLVCGWWGIPWGPIWTISTFVSNCRGGIDVTDQVARSLQNRAA